MSGNQFVDCMEGRPIGEAEKVSLIAPAEEPAQASVQESEAEETAENSEETE